MCTRRRDVNKKLLQGSSSARSCTSIRQRSFGSNEKVTQREEAKLSKPKRCSLADSFAVICRTLCAFVTVTNISSLGLKLKII